MKKSLFGNEPSKYIVQKCCDESVKKRKKISLNFSLRFCYKY